MMLLEYSYTFELCILALRKRILKKRENAAARERATSKTMALFGALIFKTMGDMQIQI